MLDRHLRARGVSDERVLRAMSRLPREQFVPEPEREASYCDGPLAIGHGQTISQPYMTAIMAQALQLNGDERVLEVGTGSGFAAALLGLLAGEVISLELVPELAERARETLRLTGCGENVTVIAADGSQGYAEGAPYDAISVAAGAPAIPDALLEQLADSGRLVIPVGPERNQELQLIRKEQGILHTTVVTGCSFVPLLGRYGWPA